MNEMNILTLNGEQYEVADQKAREDKADKTYVDEKLALKADSTSLDGKVDKSPIGAATPDDTQEVHLTPEGKLVTKPTGSGGGSDINDSAIATGSTWSSKKLSETFAPAIPVTVAGTTASTDMVSPVEHKVDCKVESRNHIDMSAIKSASGAKISITSVSATEIIITEEVGYTGNGGLLTSYKLRDITSGIIPGMSYKIDADSSAEVKKMFLAESNKTLTYGSSYVFTEAMLDSRVTLYGSHERQPERVCTIRNLQIVSKDSINHFTPYVSDLTAVTVSQTGTGVDEPRIFHPSSDGTVPGIMSISPTMEITTDNPGANLEVTYNADTKKYIKSQGVGGAGIDDSVTATNSTWSSRKMVDTFYGYMPVTVSGNYIGIDDVSGVKQEVKCKISGNVEDLSAVTVSRYGRNLFDITQMVTHGNARLIDSETGEIEVTSPDGLPEMQVPLRTGALKVSVEFKDSVEDHSMSMAFFYTDGSFESLLARPGIAKFVSVSGITNPSKTIDYIKFGGGGGLRWGSRIRKAIVSPYFSDFEPYIEPQTIIPSSDGTVTGMTSIFPSMTILTNNPNVTIEATYHADLKKYIDNQSMKVTDAILSLGGNV